MRIAEVRKLIERYNEKQLRVIVAEMYKAIPKAIKEDKDIDGMLADPDALTGSKKRGQKAPAVPDITFLQIEAEEFMEHAYQQYYFLYKPNTVIPKRQRSKWRFIAKRLHNDLLAAAASEEQLPDAAALLEKLYVLLCYACEYTLFNTDDPFGSIGIEQPAFFRNILTLKSRLLPMKEFTEQMVSLIIDNERNWNTSSMELMGATADFLTTPDAKELAIGACDKRLHEIEKKPAQKKKNVAVSRPDTSEIARKLNINRLVDMALLCFGWLHEYERGIEYFNEHYMETNPEIRLYCMLKFLFSFGQTELFVREYERAVKNGVKPREQLVKNYNKVQKSGTFSVYF